ncbi:MAG TPA: penicillin-binding protein 1A [Stellaceae bacterium]|nr:penicillin-binding protein 1A [Stellaceae bacterium]
MRFIAFLVKFLFGLVVSLVLIGVGVAALAVWYFGRDLPDYQQLVDYQPPIVSRVHAGDGRLLAEYATEKRVFVPASEIPPRVIHAFLAAEDRNFYSHIGIDPVAMARAGATDIVRVLTHRRPIGASTITQQVAKNFLVGSELSYQRKIKEALVALKMEKALGKDRVLELYLNEIYLGSGAYGVAAAALTYFDKSLDELSVPEAAFLAALPKAPNNYNPLRYPDAAKARRDWVIDRMVEAGFLSPEDGAKAQAAPIKLRHRDETEVVTANYFAEEVRRDLLARYGEKALYQSGLSVRTSLDPNLQAIADRALRAGLVAYDRRHGYRGPLAHVAGGGDWRARLAGVPAPAGAGDAGWKTAIVLAVGAESAAVGLAAGTAGVIPFDEMRWARKVLDEDRLGAVPARPAEVVSAGDVVLVEPLAGEAKSAKEPRYALRQIPAVSGALAAIDPHTGRVLALSGGFSYEMSQFDRATQARRQTGSAIKPFVYLAALDHGYTPSTLVLDAPVVIDQGPGLPKWRPSNYEHRYFGPTTLRVGLEQSHDLMTVRMGADIGLDAVAQHVERFGIMDRMPREYSMLIGAEETTPLRLTAAYAMLVNGGKKIVPTLIDRVQDRNGVTIYRADERPCEGCENVDWNDQPPPELPDTREQIVDPRSAYQVVSMMQGVVERGTGRVVASLGRPLAGKTGTTNESNDTWFVGFSPDLAVGVFVGYDQPKGLGRHETGGVVAAPVFRDFMAAALKDQPPIPFRIPPGIELVRVNATTGQLARPGDKTVIYEAFKPGTEPTGEGPVTVSGASSLTDDEDAASMGETGGEAPPAPDSAPTAAAPVAAGTAPAAVSPPPAPAPALSTAPRTVPATGTGGLY